MEDGIERNTVTIYDSINSYEKNEKKQLYICMPKNGLWEDILIIDDYNKAIEISNKKNYKIEIYNCGLDGIYQKS